MTQLPDPTELLAGANPVSAYEIDPARLDAMITRVASQPAPSRLSLLRTWQLRTGSAVAAAAVLVTALVVSLSGAPQGLSVLALNGATPIAGSAAPSGVTYGLSFSAAKASTPAAKPTSNLVAGTQLSRAAGSAAVLRFTTEKDPSAQLKSIAIDLGALDASASATGAWRVNGTNAIVTARAAPVTSFNAASLVPAAPIAWAFSMRNSHCPASSSGAYETVTCPTVQNAAGSGATSGQLVTWSKPYLQKLTTRGLFVDGLSVGRPTVDRFANTIDYPLEVAGAVVVNQYEQFQFTDYGLLIHASGLLGRTTLVNHYPLLSPAAGVTLLQGAALSGINPGGPMIPAPSTTTTPSTQTARSVTLDYELAKM
jgi:hypothetical protein